jgi:hypothetical protein
MQTKSIATKLSSKKRILPEGKMQSADVAAVVAIVVFEGATVCEIGTRLDSKQRGI